jgi:hypothetical protein
MPQEAGWRLAVIARDAVLSRTGLGPEVRAQSGLSALPGLSRLVAA